MNQYIPFNLIEDSVDTRTRAQRASDWVCNWCGSWSFIVIFALLTITWMAMNTLGSATFDRPPFIGLNLVFTVVELFQGPLIMMSQNRQMERDREAWSRMNKKLDKLLEQK